MAFCTCEECARSELGTIKDEETVGRLIFSPDHVRKSDKTIKPGAFPLSHIQHKGLSLVRTDTIPPNELRTFADAVAAHQTGRQWHGVVAFPTKTVRSLTSPENHRLICLFDDPTPSENNIPANAAHALLVAAQDGMSDPDAKEIRAAILRDSDFQSAA